MQWSAVTGNVILSFYRIGLFMSIQQCLVSKRIWNSKWNWISANLRYSLSLRISRDLNNKKENISIWKSFTQFWTYRSISGFVFGLIFQIFYRSRRRNPDITPLHRAILLDYVRISFPTWFKGKAKPLLIIQAYNNFPYSTKTIPTFRSLFDFVYLLFVGNESMEVQSPHNELRSKNLIYWPI